MTIKNIERIIEICKTAGNEIMKVYSQNDVGVQIKDDDSPVTKADIAAHKIIKAGLQELDRSIPIVSEEGRNRTSAKAFWLVDPLDGTKSFIKKQGEFTVNIALIENNMPTLGVVYVPVKETTYYCDGKKSFKIEKDGQVKQISCRKLPEEGYTVVASLSHRTTETNDFIKNLPKVSKIITASSSLKFCVVAEGLADIYPRLGRTMEWDTAAGQAVIQGAGGKVETLKGETFSYNKNEIFENGYFVVKGLN